MAKHHIPDSHVSHPNVTPLIDVIMCLIIFFMLVAKIGVTSGEEEVAIPATFMGSKIDDMGNTFTLNMKDQRDAELHTVTGLVHNVPGRMQLLNSTGQNELLNVLKEYKSQNPDFKVIIRANAELEWRWISPILDTCNAAGVKTIAYDTKEEASRAK